MNTMNFNDNSIVNPVQPVTNVETDIANSAQTKPEFYDTSDSAPDGRSTLFSKLTAEERAALDEALINRDPPTYKAVYEKFRLAEKQVSYTAYFCYARRIRHRAAIAQCTSDILKDAPDFDSILPGLIIPRLVDALMDEDSSPTQINRLVYSYVMASGLGFNRRRLEAKIELTLSQIKSARQDRDPPVAVQKEEPPDPQMLQALGSILASKRSRAPREHAVPGSRSTTEQLPATEMTSVSGKPRPHEQPVQRSRWVNRRDRRKLRKQNRR